MNHEPTFKRPGSRVRYNYTDGPVPAGTLGTVLGFLGRSQQAQIRWDDETVSAHTPDEFDVVPRGTRRAVVGMARRGKKTFETYASDVERSLIASGVRPGQADVWISNHGSFIDQQFKSGTSSAETAERILEHERGATIPFVDEARHHALSGPSSLTIDDELSARRIATGISKSLQGAPTETWVVYPHDSPGESVLQVQLYKSAGHHGWSAWTGALTRARDRDLAQLVSAAKNSNERLSAGEARRRTAWSDWDILDSVERHHGMTPEAKDRAFELIDLGYIDATGTWKLTPKGRRAWKRDAPIRPRPVREGESKTVSAKDLKPGDFVRGEKGTRRYRVLSVKRVGGSLPIEIQVQSQGTWHFKPDDSVEVFRS